MLTDITSDLRVNAERVSRCHVELATISAAVLMLHDAFHAMAEQWL